MSQTTSGSIPWRSRSQRDLATKSCPAITLFFEVGFYKYFTEMITILRWLVAHNIWVAKGQGDLAAKSYLAHNLLYCYLKSDFTTISQKLSTYLDDVSHATFWSLPWRSRSQHDLEAKSCQAHNFVIWSGILKLFHRNNHHIKTTCHKQDLGRYLEGQGHSMTLQQNHVRPITWLFEVWFYNYFTEMITILRRHVANNIRVDTLKVKVTAWPCNKIVSGHNFVFWSRILQIFHRNDHHIEMTCRPQYLGRYL